MGSAAFDYVIVGAGSAGCVLANRLSEDPGITVALIEAGGRDRNPWIHIPAGYYRTFSNPAVTWQFGSGPEPFLDGRIVNWPRGRVLGGSSSVNGLLYVRGQSQDFDVWRQLGNVGWGWSDVLPYFKRAEDQERGADELHGAGGPLGVSDVRIRQKQLCDAFIAGCVHAGIPHTNDFNGPEQEGAGYYQLTNRNGRRCSTAVGYLKPVRSRRNLHIVTDALVHGVELEGRRATGIRCRRHDRVETITARREVILAAGAIGSPQILQLSGIGPCAALRAAGVPVLHELPGVGENLQDHLQVRFVYHCQGHGSLNDIWHSPWLRLRAGLDYALGRRGILTIGAGVAGAFARSRPDVDLPDVQFHFMPLSADRPGQGLHPFSGVTASVCQLRPESRGTLKIAGPDPTAHPAIVSNYLAAEVDRRVLLDGMKLTRRVAAAPAFARHVLREHLPGPEVASDDALMAYARGYATTVFHPCGTAKMGSDGNAVVDARLRVRGLAGLRVADASIMPTLTSGNTNAPTIMIAEKAADMIREDARVGATAFAPYP
ncbi:MAG TPA: choline dehydrogenase [Hyphomicrobiaceae bacterium]|nr:choline dehydrogenase [Hyphomicrobiaceae bacterium]